MAGVLAMVAACKGGGIAPDTSATIQIVITPSSPVVAPGGHVTLHVSVTGPPGISQTVVWRSQNPEIATISATGVVTGVAEGTATIKASWAEDQQEFSVVNVLVTSNPIEMTSIVVSPPAKPKGS